MKDTDLMQQDSDTDLEDEPTDLVEVRSGRDMYSSEGGGRQSDKSLVPIYAKEGACVT